MEGCRVSLEVLRQPLGYCDFTVSLCPLVSNKTGSSAEGIYWHLELSPQIFEVYEPLRFHYLTDVEKLQVLRAFLTCKFTPSSLWEKDYFPPFWYLKETSYYVKPSKNQACVKYRSGRKHCFPAGRLFQGFLDKCRQKFDSTVVKELSDRLPHRRLSSVIPEIIHGPHRQCWYPIIARGTWSQGKH